jgi:hypothetical protein
MNPCARTTRYAQLATALALHSDAQLQRLVEDAGQLASGIGGSTLSFELEGVKVFAKRVRLTELEQRPEHLRSTANVFALPAFCQRNVGSVGFGVWRELAAHVMSTGWVLSGAMRHFPLMFHWRVLQGAAPQAAELGDIGQMVGQWQGSDALRRRLQALAEAQASVVIFLEHLPWNLEDWLDAQRAAGPQALEQACLMVEQGLTVDLPKMNRMGLLHGDAHLGNILTDGRQLYFADFGLATSARFALAADEVRYLQQNASLDRAFALTTWIKWRVKAGAPEVPSGQQRMEMVRAVAQGQAASRLFPGLAAAAADIVARRAAVATVVTDFYVQLRAHSPDTPYPQQAIEALLGPAPG